MDSLRFGSRKLVIAITGRKESSPRYTLELAKAAMAAGRIAAEMGLTVLTGGLSGVMERAAEGAKIASGETIGILPSNQHNDGNRFLDLVLPSGIGIARNVLMASACDFMLALPGGTGTLEELCFALDFDRPVISWGSWEIEGVRAVPFPNEDLLFRELKKLVDEKMKLNPNTNHKLK
jgi:uncharacterized protein (TIGR00725 family)